MARPSKLSPEVVARVVEAISVGSSREVAARYAGISATSFYRWMDEGEDARSDSAKRQFREAVHEAEDQLQVELAARVKLAAVKDWRAAVEILKRRFPQDWGNTMRVMGADGGPVEVRTREQAVKDGQERARHLRAV